MSWGDIIKKSINGDIESIISSIESLISTDADNNSAKVSSLQKAIDELNEAIRK